MNDYPYQRLHCYVCKTYFPPHEFYRDRTRRSGYSSKCKACADIARLMRDVRVIRG